MSDPAQPNSAPSSPARFFFWLGGAAVAICFAVLTWQTWRKWGDMLVDFGVQLYLPWKLSTGAVLYRDISYLTGGPLSQYYHSWLFRIFGVSVLTVIVSNLVLLALLTAVIYVRFQRISDAWTAIMATLALLLVFAFEQHTAEGIFNFVSPYCHEIVHGIVLSVVVLWLLSRWLAQEKAAPAFWAGVGSGLVLLTKPEVSLALGLAQMAALAWCWRVKRKPFLLARSLLAMMGGALLPLAAFFLYFIQHEDFTHSVRSVLWAWVPVFTATPYNNFYAWCLGLYHPGNHITAILQQTAGLTALVGGCAALFLLNLSHLGRKLMFVLVAVAVARCSYSFRWSACGYCLPSLCLAALGLFFRQASRQGLAEAPGFPLLWIAFSLALMAKLGLFPRVWHYGFALAMPAFLTGVYCLLWQVPALFASPAQRTPARYFRAVVTLGLLIGYAQIWEDSAYIFRQRSVTVGQGADRMLVFRPEFRPSSVTLARVADWIETNTPAQSTLAVLPDGSMLNYLTRRNNPAGYLRWNPAESSFFGQDNMNHAFMSTRPDYIILVEFNIGQFGLPPFGQDARDGLVLKQWIDAHYRIAYRTGPPAVAVYQRNSEVGENSQK